MTKWKDVRYEIRDGKSGVGLKVVAKIHVNARVKIWDAIDNLMVIIETSIRRIRRPNA